MTGSGLLSYGPKLEARIVLSDNLVEYYRQLIPPSIKPNGSRYAPHLTIVRHNIEFPPNMEVWGKYTEEIVQFKYEPTLLFEEKYVYLKVYSDRIGEIREELGLTQFRIGFDCYHLTIGNYK